MADTPGPCCYVLCPNPHAAAVKVYVGMALNGRTRLAGHVGSGVNSLVGKEAEVTDKREWSARVWFQETQMADQHFPTPARHFLEHLAIVAAGSTLPGQHPLQHNTMDRISSITLVTAAEVVKIIRILDAVLAYGLRLSGSYPPGSEVSMNTLVKAMKGVHRPHILAGMDPPPTNWLAYINSPEEDFGQIRNTGFPTLPLPSTGRPVPTAAVTAFDPMRIGSHISRHSPYTHVGLLDNLADAIEIQARLCRNRDDVDKLENDEDAEDEEMRTVDDYEIDAQRAKEEDGLDRETGGKLWDSDDYEDLEKRRG